MCIRDRFFIELIRHFSRTQYNSGHIQFVHSLCRLTAGGEEAMEAKEKQHDITTAELDGLVSMTFGTLPDMAYAE